MATLVEYGTRCLYENTNFFSVLIVRSASWLKLKSSHFLKCCEENFYLCVRLMQNRMKMFSTTAKLLVWRLRLRVQKAQSPHYWHKTGKNLKSVNQYKYLGAVLDIELSDDKDIQRQLRSKILCNKQVASLFSRCSNAVKTVLFRSFIRPCMHHNYGGISESHACKDCVWPIILDALYNLSWRARVSSHDSSGSIQHSYIEGCIKKKYALVSRKMHKI